MLTGCGRRQLPALRLRLEQLAHGVARSGRRPLQRAAVCRRHVPLQHVPVRTHTQSEHCRLAVSSQFARQRGSPTLEALRAEGAAEQTAARLPRHRRLLARLVGLAMSCQIVPEITIFDIIN